MPIAVLHAMMRPLLEHRLPSGVTIRWFEHDDELIALAGHAEIGWFDIASPGTLDAALTRAGGLRWLNTLGAGVDTFPLDRLRERGVTMTNGAGLHAGAVAEYAVLGMLTIAKGYRDVVHAQDRSEWLFEPPGKRELDGSRALIVGAGAIGGRIAALLQPFGVETVTVRRGGGGRGGGSSTLGPDAWRAQLAEFDWVIVTVPSTAETARMIGAAELAAMRPGAALLNFARGAVIDQDALVAALRSEHLGAAFLDVTDPEPLPPEHPLWSLPNAHISMHLSGRSQVTLINRGADRFLDNLDRWQRGKPLLHTVDLRRGY